VKNGERASEKRLREMFASVDRMDPDEIAGSFTEDGSFRANPARTSRITRT
jgi:hypothetical protein